MSRRGDAETFGDLTTALRLKHPAGKAPKLPATAAELAKAQYEVAHYPAPQTPPTHQTMPSQERGHRRHV